MTYGEIMIDATKLQREAQEIPADAVNNVTVSSDRVNAYNAAGVDVSKWHKFCSIVSVAFLWR